MGFNMFMNIGLCVCISPGNEFHKVKNLPVLIVNAIWCFISLIWLYVILSIISHGVIEIWEAILTFMLFPLMVFAAYVADKFGSGSNLVQTEIQNIELNALAAAAGAQSSTN